MKDKNVKRSKQSLKIELYERVIIQLMQIITASGIKIPGYLLQIIETCFPSLPENFSDTTVKETRCKYCAYKKSCNTGLYRFQIGGCSDKFKKSILYFWKKV